MANRQITLNIGPNEPALDKQLEGQGFLYKSEELQVIQAQVATAWRMYLENKFTDDEYSFARRNIMMVLVGYVEQWNNIKIDIKSLGIAA